MPNQPARGVVPDIVEQIAPERTDTGPDQQLPPQEMALCQAARKLDSLEVSAIVLTSAAKMLMALGLERELAIARAQLPHAPGQLAIRNEGDRELVSGPRLAGHIVKLLVSAIWAAGSHSRAPGAGRGVDSQGVRLDT